MLHESEEYSQIVDMPRKKDQIWQQFTKKIVRSRLGVDKARKLSCLSN